MTPEQNEAENKRDRLARLHINSLTWKLVELIELSTANNEVKILASQLHDAMRRNVAANFLAKEMNVPSVAPSDLDADAEAAFEKVKKNYVTPAWTRSECGSVSYDGGYGDGFLACWKLLKSGEK